MAWIALKLPSSGKALVPVGDIFRLNGLWYCSHVVHLFVVPSIHPWWVAFLSSCEHVFHAPHGDASMSKHKAYLREVWGDVSCALEEENLLFVLYVGA